MRSSITIGILAAVAGKVTYAHVNADCEGVTVDVEGVTVDDGYASFEFKPCGEGRHKSSSITITQPDLEVESVFTFCDDGLVTDIVVDGESEYVVKYDSDGELDEVESKSSDRRGLRRGGHQGGGKGRGRGGRHDSSSSDDDDVCSECEAWNEVCQLGVSSVCALVYYDGPIDPVGDSVISLLCDALGTACNDATTIEDTCLALCDEDGGSDSSDGSDSMDTTNDTTTP